MNLFAAFSLGCLAGIAAVLVPCLAVAILLIRRAPEAPEGEW